MRPIRVVRAAIAVALVAVSFISFPSFLSAGLFTVSAPAADRMFKGDGLPLTAPAGSPMIGTPGVAAAAIARKGADRLRGRLQPDRLAARLANVFRRCTV